MIVGAAVCPGAPFLVPGVAESLASHSADLMAAARQAIERLAGADRLLVISAARTGRPTRQLPAGSACAGAALGRSDLGGGSPDRADAAVGSVVGAGLLTRFGPIPRPAVDTIEVTVDGEVADTVVGPDRVGLLVIADGAATHGDDAPGRRDDRAGPFDDALADALAAGSPGALARACADRALAGALLAVTAPLRALAALTEPDPPTAAALLYRGRPYGVGYLVASWQWGRR